MNFRELWNKINLYLNNDTLGPLPGEWIRAAQQKLENTHSFNCMEAEATITSSTMYVDIPTRFKEAISFRVKDGDLYYMLLRDSSGHALNAYPYPSTNTGRPTTFTTMPSRGSFMVRPTPDKSYTYDLHYYQYLPELQADTDSNWWTENAWEILLYGALLMSNVYLPNDARLPIWKAMYDESVTRLAQAEGSEKWAGSPLMMKASYVV